MSPRESSVISACEFSLKSPLAAKRGRSVARRVWALALGAAVIAAPATNAEACKRRECNGQFPVGAPMQPIPMQSNPAPMQSYPVPMQSFPMQQSFQPAFQPMMPSAQFMPAASNCGCVRQVMQPITTTVMQPVTTTVMQPVTRTEIRREAQTVQVPVVSQRQVTVDEGGFQQVWVPKMVQKTVSETSMQSQIQYRDVAYQVNGHQAVQQTQMVPTQVTAYGAPTTIIGSAPYVGTAMVPSPGVAYGPIPESQQAYNVPTAIANGQVDANQNWSKVPAAAAESGKKIELQSYENVVPQPQGRFSPAPTAATVWQARGGLTR